MHLLPLDIHNGTDDIPPIGNNKSGQSRARKAHEVHQVHPAGMVGSVGPAPKNKNGPVVARERERERERGVWHRLCADSPEVPSTCTLCITVPIEWLEIRQS